MGFNFPFAKNWYFLWNPQVYYLRMDDLGGFFAAQSITVSHKKIPVSLSSMMNISLEEENEIPAEDFNWNKPYLYI